MGNPKQKWTSEEEEALRAGVRKHGTGKWKDIQKDPEFNPHLSSRSNIDLKDKWRNMSVSGGMGGGPREKVNAKPRDAPVTLFANPTTPSSAAVKREASTAPVKREAATSSVDKGEPTAADDSPTEAKADAITPQMYNTWIIEALKASKDGLETGAIANYIEQQFCLEKKNEIPQNFRRVLSTKLRRLVRREKIEKVQNCFKVKSDSSGGASLTTSQVSNTPKQKETPPAPKQNETPSATNQNAVQPSQVKEAERVAEAVEDAAKTAAYRIAEAENRSFVAAEAVKEVERVAQMFEDSKSMLQSAEEFLKKCSQGEVLQLV